MPARFIFKDINCFQLLFIWSVQRIVKVSRIRLNLLDELIQIDIHIPIFLNRHGFTESLFSFLQNLFNLCLLFLLCQFRKVPIFQLLLQNMNVLMLRIEHILLLLLKHLELVHLLLFLFFALPCGALRLVLHVLWVQLIHPLISFDGTFLLLKILYVVVLDSLQVLECDLISFLLYHTNHLLLLTFLVIYHVPLNR